MSWSLRRRGLSPALVFAVALAVYWIEAIAWPLRRGRDSWDYWLYYLQLGDRHPVFWAVQLFRTPLTPLVTGIPMSVGGAQLLEIVMSLIYAAALLGWAWSARPFGRRASIITALVALALLPYAAMFHEVSSDFLFGALLAPWTGFVIRAWLRPTTRVLVLLGLLTAALTLARPAGQVLVLAACAVALVAPGAGRMRLTRLGVAAAAAIVPLLLWAGLNAIRYDDFTVARGGKAWVPFFKVFSLKTIEPSNGPASRRLGAAIERDVLTLPQYKRLHVDLQTYLHSPSNLEAIRLIALSDRDFGRSSNYSVLFDASWEAIRHAPGDYVRSVSRTFRDFLWFRFSLEPVRPEPPPAPGTRVLHIDGKESPSPEAVSPMAQAARYGFVWCPTDAIDRCIFRHPEQVFPTGSQQRRYVELTNRVRDWNAQLPLRNGWRWLAAKLGTLSWDLPTAPIVWLLLAAIGLVVRRARGWPALLVLASAGLSVLVVHALSQEPQAEFSIPLTPMFALAAVAALFGRRAGSATVQE
jgi:hypothetical protein